MNGLLPIYHRMPALVRHAAASLRGLTMLRDRYGAGAEERVAEVLERDRWSAAQWKTFQENRLAFVLHRAATQVPYYRDQWAERRRTGDRVSWEYLENWRLVTKDNIRQNPRAFLPDDADPKHLIEDTTGGTTGTPLRVWLSRDTQRANYAIWEARTRRWYGVSRHEPWGTMGGKVITHADAQRPPYWVYNVPLRQIYLSTYHLSRETAPFYMDAIKRHHTTNIVAYTTSIAYLARQAIDLGIAPPPDLRVIITNAEGLFPWQRDIIKQGLGADAFATYGMVELVACGSEKDGKFYQWPEIGLIEVFADESDMPVAAGESGRFVCTGLLNADMPLIRYDVGDRGSVGATPYNVSAFAYPLITSIEGRKTELLINAQGRRVWYFNPLFTGISIREAQVVQESLKLVRILYVPAPGFSEADKETILSRFRMRMGDVPVRFELVERVPREANNKFKLVVCRVPEEELRQIGETS